MFKVPELHPPSNKKETVGSLPHPLVLVHVVGTRTTLAGMIPPSCSSSCFGSPSFIQQPTTNYVVDRKGEERKRRRSEERRIHMRQRRLDLLDQSSFDNLAHIDSPWREDSYRTERGGQRSGPAMRRGSGRGSGREEGT